MNRPALLLSLWLLTSSALAQPLLQRYERATAALQGSIAALPDDQVGSLDALRDAEAAFGALGSELDADLRRGLSETFSRAEQAVVNGSSTDLAVQAAVLRGGFGRVLYEAALRSAAEGEVARAQNLLGVLGRDLGFAQARFSGEDQRALQRAFETRLAALARSRLENPGEGLAGHYRMLADLYSYVFLVQDSPRLSSETRETVLTTIRALLAGRPIDGELALLGRQLESFARRAAAGNVPTTAEVVPATEPAAAAQDRRAAPPPLPTADPQNVAAAAPAPAALEAQASSPFPDVLGVPLAKLLLVAAGLLALLGLGQLLAASARSPSPRHDAALALLLLPAVAEGLLTLVSLLAPSAEAGRYSLFVHPTTQLVWAGLTAAAVFCLAGGRRTARAEAPSARRGTQRIPAVRAAPEPGAPSTEAAPAAERSPSPARSGGAAASALRWDDF